MIIALANILQEVSNVFKNGKCLSYKTGWKEKKLKRKKVHNLFLEQVRSTILKDLKKHQLKTNVNANYILGDSRIVTESLNEKFDLMITSPPYLNSRDYTDIYRLELWILGYISKFKSEKVLRKRALTSHVQIQLPKVEYPKGIKELEDAISHLEGDSIESWNKNIPNMVRGYFKDMETILSNLFINFNSGARLYINVSNSSYFHFVIEVDIIIAKIAEQVGYNCKEIRIARIIKTSNQQKKFINSEKMRESVIVLECN